MTFTETWFWFITTRKRVSFDEVSHFEYNYSEMGTSHSLTFNGYIAKDSVEKFTIDALTHDNATLRVCVFRGEGSKETGWAGVLLHGDSIIDFAGTQEDDSRNLMSLLVHKTGIPNGKVLDADKELEDCPSCGHKISPYCRQCLYCGAEIFRDEDVS